MEDRLPAVLRELQIRALEDDHRRQEQARHVEEKRRLWEQAMEQARHDFREASRARELAGQLERWRLARDVDAYLSQMRAVISQMAAEDERAEAEGWLAWVTEYRQSIDPLRQPLRMPPEAEPRKEDLRPFLNGWSPYGPD